MDTTSTIIKVIFDYLCLPKGFFLTEDGYIHPPPDGNGWVVGYWDDTVKVCSRISNNNGFSGISIFSLNDPESLPKIKECLYEYCKNKGYIKDV